MKRIICNQCRKEDVADGVYASAPKGWLSVTRSKNYESTDADVYADLHLCGLACLVQFGQDRLVCEEGPANPPPPTTPPYTPTLGDA